MGNGGEQLVDQLRPLIDLGDLRVGDAITLERLHQPVLREPFEGHCSIAIAGIGCVTVASNDLIEYVIMIPTDESSVRERQHHRFEAFGDLLIRIDDGLQQVVARLALADVAEVGADLAADAAHLVAAQARHLGLVEEDGAAHLSVTAEERFAIGRDRFVFRPAGFVPCQLLLHVVGGALAGGLDDVEL